MASVLRHPASVTASIGYVQADHRRPFLVERRSRRFAACNALYNGLQPTLAAGFNGALGLTAPFFVLYCAKLISTFAAG